jgi:hypothetical protein
MKCKEMEIPLFMLIGFFIGRRKKGIVKEIESGD